MFALLCLLPLALATPVDELHRLRQTNRLEGRAVEPAVVNISAALFHDMAIAGITYPAGVNPLTIDKPLVKRQSQFGRTTGIRVDSPAFVPDSRYLFPITVGKTVFKVMMNTMATDFWLYSKALPTAQKQGRKVYQNTGRLVSGQTFAYDQLSKDYTASGPVYEDSVTLGGWNFAKQWLGSANKVSTALNADLVHHDGVMGWGWDLHSTCMPQNCRTFFGNLYVPIMNAGALHTFAATFRSKSTGKNSTWDIGFIDPNLYTGSLYQTQAYYDRGYWDIFIQGWSVGTGAQFKKEVFTVVDTLSPWIFVDSDIIKMYYAKVPGSYYDENLGMVYPCNVKLPTFSIWLNGNKRTMSAANAYAGEYDATTCAATIQWNGDIDQNTRLGISFLRSQYVVFRNGDGTPTQAVGFAQQKL